MSARSSSRARTVVATVLLIAGGTLLAPPARAQSLADVAKKEEERRKALAEPAKVYTNKDLNAAPAGSPPPVPAPAAGAAPAVTPGGDAAKDAAKDADGTTKTKAARGVVKDQAYWAGRLKELQDKMQRDENYADAMQTRINALTTDAVNRDDPAQRAVIERNRQKSLAELASLTKSVEGGKKAIADLYEEARRAGVPPGWLR